MQPGAHVFRNHQVERRTEQAVALGVGDNDVELIAGAGKGLTLWTYRDLESRRMRHHR